MERHLAAILAADVVGYSRLMERDEVDTFTRLRAHRKDLFEPEIEKHHGRVFKLMGDGLLAEFASVVDAVECAVGLQRGMAERNKGVADDRRIHVRIGINLGDVIVEGEDRHGEGVNIAARLQQLGEPGGIAVSRTVYNHVRNKLALGFESLGEYQVKNIAEPVAVYRVLLQGTRKRSPIIAVLTGSRRRRMAGTALATALLIVVGALVWNEYFRQPLTALPLPDKPSLAVLPFDNLSDDPTWDRLADGMTEDVITNLSLSRDLFVIARNSTFVYRDQPVDMRRVGRELGVKYVLEGSIQRASDRVRVTTQLIEAATGRHVWSERYDRPLEDLFAVQDEVTQAIASTLLGYEGAIAEAERAVARRKPPASLQAYDYYLLGIEAKHKETKEDNIRAQELLKKALELDPGFARAYIGLAWTYGYEIWLGYTESATRTRGDWLAAAQKAVALDPYDGEAHTVLGYAYLYSGDYERAAPELDRGLELHPNNADQLMNYVDSLALLGSPQKGVELAERAIRLNPNYPAWYIRILHREYYFAAEFEKALAAARRVPNPVAYDYALLGASYGQLGRNAEAAEAAAKVLELDPDWSAERQISDFGSFARQAELDLFLDGIRKAGLPVCASATALQQRPEIKRLPVCERARATN